MWRWQNKKVKHGIPEETGETPETLTSQVIMKHKRAVWSIRKGVCVKWHTPAPSKFPACSCPSFPPNEARDKEPLGLAPGQPVGKRLWLPGPACSAPGNEVPGPPGGDRPNGFNLIPGTLLTSWRGEGRARRAHAARVNLLPFCGGRASGDAFAGERRQGSPKAPSQQHRKCRVRGGELPSSPPPLRFHVPWGRALRG